MGIAFISSQQYIFLNGQAQSLKSEGMNKAKAIRNEALNGIRHFHTFHLLAVFCLSVSPLSLTSNLSLHLSLLFLLTPRSDVAPLQMPSSMTGFTPVQKHLKKHQYSLCVIVPCFCPLFGTTLGTSTFDFLLTLHFNQKSGLSLLCLR